ncbi:MAG: hypothetical protein ACOX1V_03970 [Candidatus Iainarchaeum sp.]|jgi:ubiquinone/menaquinone biosynthesis C-methylase UbiE|nr:MAG: hypothetical protein BWY55_00368 [archaeon ADurb.Bin336]
MSRLVRKRSLGKKQNTSVLDIGFEDAKKIKELAKKHPKKKFMGVEWVKKSKLQTRTHNLKLTYGDALSKLRRLPSASVNIITADFFFSEFKIKGRELSAFSLRKEMSEKFAKRKADTLKQVSRVLAKNGRFFVLEYGADLEKTISLLNNNGFVCTKKPVPKNQMDRTYFLSLIKDRMIIDARNASAWQPFIITARKKPVSNVKH